MNELSSRKCSVCRGGDPPITDLEIGELHPLIPEWQVIEVDGVKRLQRIFKFKTYARSLKFANEIAAMAEEEDHHPLIILEWGRVTVQWWTHVVKGLHMNDFILAARTDSLGG